MKVYGASCLAEMIAKASENLNGEVVNANQVDVSVLEQLTTIYRSKQ